MPIVVIGLSYRTSPVTVRERFAFPDAMIPETLQKLRAQGLAQEAVILSTCNRVLYAAIQGNPAADAPALRQFLLDCHNYQEPLHDEFTPSASRKASSICSKWPAASTRWSWAKPKSWAN